MSEHEIVCFHCGQSVGDPPHLNRIGGQEPCRACAERMLETLPGIFHAPYETAAGTMDTAQLERGQVGQGRQGYDDAGSV